MRASTTPEQIGRQFLKQNYPKDTIPKALLIKMLEECPYLLGSDNGKYLGDIDIVRVILTATAAEKNKVEHMCMKESIDRRTRTVIELFDPAVFEVEDLFPFMVEITPKALAPDSPLTRNPEIRDKYFKKYPRKFWEFPKLWEELMNTDESQEVLYYAVDAFMSEPEHFNHYLKKIEQVILIGSLQHAFLEKIKSLVHDRKHGTAMTAANFFLKKRMREAIPYDLLMELLSFCGEVYFDMAINKRGFTEEQIYALQKAAYDCKHGNSLPYKIKQRVQQLGKADVAKD